MDLQQEMLYCKGSSTRRIVMVKDAVVSSYFWYFPPNDIPQAHHKHDIKSGFLRVFYRDKLLSSYEASTVV